MTFQGFRDIAQASLVPEPIALEPRNLFAVPFFLMKLLPADYILTRAAAEGRIGEGAVVIETTSGTFGLALAILCNLRRYRLILVSDPAIDEHLKRRLEDLGARVEIVTEPAPLGGFQAARLERMGRLRREHSDHFWPSQYHNPGNPRAYAPLCARLVQSIGRIDCLVGPVGSGGSLSGSARYLRTLFPALSVVGVDTFGSVLFGQPDQKRLLRGLGNSLMPANLDHRGIDEVHWVSARAAFRATRDLHRRHSLFMGPTSGAVHLVARWWAERRPEQNVVALFPDEGYRYQASVYDDAWLRAQGAWLSESPAEPLLVRRPAEARPDWSRLLWGRRGYEEVVGRPWQAREAS